MEPVYTGLDGIFNMSHGFGIRRPKELLCFMVLLEQSRAVVPRPCPMAVHQRELVSELEGMADGEKWREQGRSSLWS